MSKKLLEQVKEYKNIVISDFKNEIKEVDTMTIELAVKQMESILSNINGKGLMTVEDIALILGISTSVVYEMFKNNVFTITIIGKKKFVTTINFCKWLSIQ